MGSNLSGMHDIGTCAHSTIGSLENISVQPHAIHNRPLEKCSAWILLPLAAFAKLEFDFDS